MIILKDIVFDYLQQSVEVELPRANMVIDPRPCCFSFHHPRPNEPYDFPRFRCEYHENGTTVTITRTNESRIETFSFRVYDPATETVPSFDSTIYTYMGEDKEFAPKDTTEIIIHPSVTVIKWGAFCECERIKKCFMHDGVHTIERWAFGGCEAMKVIRLSQSLTRIGERAFSHCDSLEAVFLPPTVTEIGENAFEWCDNLRILSLPLIFDLEFFTQIRRVGIDGLSIHLMELVHNFYGVDDHTMPPLHKACLDIHATHQTIQQCIDTHGQATVSITDHDGNTPLHILTMNPLADISTLRACFDLDMSTAFVRDTRSNTPLDNLRVHRDNIDDHTSLVSSLCMHWDATVSASSQEDHQDDTPTIEQD